MIKRLFFLLSVGILFFVSNSSIYANTDFFVNTESTYEINLDGSAKVLYSIGIVNATTEKYASQYKLSLNGVDPEDVFAKSDGKDLETSVVKTPLGADLIVLFDNAVVGEGNRRDFLIEFTDFSLVNKTGDIWEISLPRLAQNDSFDSYQIRLRIPKSIGEAGFISPDPDARIDAEGDTIYYFDKSAVSEGGVTAVFGNSQVYSFDLTYHLENPVNVSSGYSFAIPPDTAFQKVFYDSINPPVDSIESDSDGNWIAKYTLRPRERLDVRVIGHVEVFIKNQPFQKPTNDVLSGNSKPMEYWEADDPDVKKLALQLGSVEEIYKYVVTTLKYDYAKVQPNVIRLGAREALKNPKNAICTEFTDLFITLVRAIGIPAREVNGYAYTDNPDLQPLSLVSDVLHAWPEYWDSQREMWVPVDPTWQNTSGGVDYFSKLDLRHITFVNHGSSSTKPYPPGSYKLGANPQKDVFVAFSKLPVLGSSAPQVNLSQNGQNLIVQITNNAAAALYDQKLEIFYDGSLAYQKKVDQLLPYQNINFEFRIPHGVFGTNMPAKAKILFEGQSYEITTSKKDVIIKHSIIALVTLTVVISFLVITLKSKYIFQLVRRKG